jgi:hypothetical protein
MRRALVLAVVGVLAAGCGGGGGEGASPTAPAVPSGPTTTAGPADPGRDAIEAFVAAARKAQAAGMWGLLSTSSKRRLGPTLAGFRKRAAVELAESVGSFDTFRMIVSERITAEFGVVAIDGSRLVEGGRERSVYAVPLRLEGTKWRVELGTPVRVRPIGPDPGAREPVVAQVAAAVEGPGGSGTAVLYLDGQTVEPQVRGTASNATVFANFDPALAPGRHTVVVFASDGAEAAAGAWAFTVAKR